MALTRVSGGILQQPIDVGIITATSIQVGSGTTIHDVGIDLGSGNLTSHNINSTGIVTSTGLDINGDGDISGDLSVSGNVSIGGTLTYEDVTNIDSVGLITARDGIIVTGGAVGIRTDSPIAERLDIRTSDLTNIHQDLSSAHRGVFIGGDADTVVQIASNNAGSVGSGVVLTNMGSSTDGRHWVMQHGATSESNKFTLGYVTSSSDRATNLMTSTQGSGADLTITTGGNFGIKSTSPNNTLTVGDTVQPSYAPSSAGNYIEIARTSGADAGLLINKNTGQWLIGIDNSDGANSPLRFEYGAAGSAHPGFGAGTLGMIIKHDGKIGIGTDDTPTAKLDVFEAVTSTQTAIRIGNTNTPSTANNKRLEFVDGTGSTEGTNKFTYGYIQGYREGGSNAGALIFGTKPDNPGVPAEKLRITSGGSVGIGTDTPGAILEVFDATSNTILNVKSGDAGAVLNLIDDSARSSIEQNGTTLKISSDTGAEDASSDIRLQVDGSSKMIIRDSGDVVTGVPADDNQNNTGSRTVFTVADTTNGALLHLRGQSPAIFFDQSSGNVGQVFLDSVDFVIYSGTPAAAGSERLRITANGQITSGNLSINAYSNADNNITGYTQVASDNHANTFFGQNLKLGASGGSGNHALEIINQHSTIGGAGMYIGGNGSNQENAINFYAEAANQSAGTIVTSNRRAQIAPSAFFTWVEPRNQNSSAQSYLRTFGFTFNMTDGQEEVMFYNPDGYRRIYYEIYIQSGHGSNGYGYILCNSSRYGTQFHDVDWHVSHTTYGHASSVGGNVNNNGVKLIRQNTYGTVTYYVIVKAYSPAGGNPYSNSGLTDASYRYYSQGF